MLNKQEVIVLQVNVLEQRERAYQEISGRAVLLGLGLFLEELRS